MKIGVFDSGLGGLVVLRKLCQFLPEYEYVFFADQAFVPYGNKTKESLTERAQKICKYLFEKENCVAVLLACNTTSTNIYDELKNWVKQNFPNKEIWGIAKPTVEMMRTKKSVAFFGTHLTITSGFYKNEMEKLGAQNIAEIEMPELANMIEKREPTLEYISSFRNLVSENINTGVLVCTHYPIALVGFKKAFPQIREWICQEDIIPEYIKNHLNSKKVFWRQGLQKTVRGDLKIISSKQNPVFEKFCQKWFPNTVAQFIEKF